MLLGWIAVKIAARRVAWPPFVFVPPNMRLSDWHKRRIAAAHRPARA
jgi:hypothetical protein